MENKRDRLDEDPVYRITAAYTSKLSPNKAPKKPEVSPTHGHRTSSTTDSHQSTAVSNGYSRSHAEHASPVHRRVYGTTTAPIHIPAESTRTASYPNYRKYHLASPARRRTDGPKARSPTRRKFYSSSSSSSEDENLLETPRRKNRFTTSDISQKQSVVDSPVLRAASPTLVARLRNLQKRKERPFYVFVKRKTVLYNDDRIYAAYPGDIIMVKIFQSSGCFGKILKEGEIAQGATEGQGWFNPATVSARPIQRQATDDTQTSSVSRSRRQGRSDVADYQEAKKERSSTETATKVPSPPSAQSNVGSLQVGKTVFADYSLKNNNSESSRELPSPPIVPKRMDHESSSRLDTHSATVRVREPHAGKGNETLMTTEWTRPSIFTSPTSVASANPVLESHVTTPTEQSKITDVSTEAAPSNHDDDSVEDRLWKAFGSSPRVYLKYSPDAPAGLTNKNGQSREPLHDRIGDHTSDPCAGETSVANSEMEDKILSSSCVRHQDMASMSDRETSNRSQSSPENLRGKEFLSRARPLEKGPNVKSERLAGGTNDRLLNRTHENRTESHTGDGTGHRLLKTVKVSPQELWEAIGMRPVMKLIHGPLFFRRLILKALFRRRVLRLKTLGIFGILRRERLFERVSARLAAVGMCVTFHRIRIAKQYSSKILCVGICLLASKYKIVEDTGEWSLNSLMSPVVDHSTRRRALTKGLELKKKEEEEEMKRMAATGPKLKPLHWDALTEQKVTGTMWDRNARKPSEGRQAPHIKRRTSTVDVGEMLPSLEQAFAMNAPKKPAPTQKAKKTETIRLLDSRKGRNAAIALRGCLGKRPLEDVRKALEDLDINKLGGIDTAETLAGLELFDDSVAHQVRQYSGSESMLDLPEKFILHVVSSVSHARSRLRTMVFLSTYEAVAEQLAEQLGKLEFACSEIQQSKRLSTLLADVILPLGNRLNERSQKSHAAGLRLRSLDKILKTTTQTGVSFIRFVIEGLMEMDRTNPGMVSKLLQVNDDFPELLSVNGSQFEWDTLSLSLSNLRDDLNSAERLYESLRSEAAAEQLCSELGEYVDQARDVIENVESAFQEAQKSFIHTCRYLGEDPSKATIGGVFGSLQRFLQSVQREYERASTRMEQEESKLSSSSGPKKPPGKPPKIADPDSHKAEPAGKNRRATLGGTGKEEPSASEKAEMLHDLNAFFMNKSQKGGHGTNGSSELRVLDEEEEEEDT
eukprot:gb/GECG01016212.1/.p1 GENE.gb/GECG01016212.1/~~gb/GECG01016212.1/.p1  ORF type:complete len:1214 (+),score=166.87 gb/GECG01016212.1/:1-3642(+)